MKNNLKSLPNALGYFGAYGGRELPPKLVSIFEAIEKEYLLAKEDSKFQEEYQDLLKNYGLMSGSLVHKERGYDLKYSIRDSFILYKIMYNSNCSLFLKRKKEKFESYMRMRS